MGGGREGGGGGGGGGGDFVVSVFLGGRGKAKHKNEFEHYRNKSFQNLGPFIFQSENVLFSHIVFVLFSSQYLLISQLCSKGRNTRQLENHCCVVLT